MSTNTTTAAESALLAARDRLHALDIPADDLPDDLLAVAAGGSLMPSLPGWTKRRARDWAAIVVRWPELARRFVAWCEANAGRLANLRVVTIEDAFLALDSGYSTIVMDRRDYWPETRNVTARHLLHLIPEEPAETFLETTLTHLNHIPRPWHAELAAAIAAARRGGIRPDTLVTIATGHQSYAYDCPAITRLRVLDDAVAAHLTAHVGRTNAGPFCGADPGELFLMELWTDMAEDGSAPLSYRFAFRPGLPWSRHLRLDGGYAEALDPAGNPAYELADFYELP